MSVHFIFSWSKTLVKGCLYVSLPPRLYYMQFWCCARCFETNTLWIQRSLTPHAIWWQDCRNQWSMKMYLRCQQTTLQNSAMVTMHMICKQIHPISSWQSCERYFSPENVVWKFDNLLDNIVFMVIFGYWPINWQNRDYLQYWWIKVSFFYLSVLNLHLKKPFRSFINGWENNVFLAKG